MARAADPGGAPAGEALPGIDAHPHARAVLLPALAPQGHPSHAYLFHGPPGTGKRTIARAFAAALLAAGAREPGTVAERVRRDSHPDLTWVRPSGARRCSCRYIEEPVVAAATRTPFESARRVFVIEAVDTMNDQAANRMLKTLEEPPSFVHLLLVTDRRGNVLPRSPRAASTCASIRFRRSGSRSGYRASARSVRRRARGWRSATRGRRARLAGEEGEALRANAERFVRAALAGETGERPWLALLELAREAGASAGEQAQELMASELELLPGKERKRYEREGLEARRRGERRVRTQTLDLSLRLAELWLRDVLCICEGAPELVYAVDRRGELEQDARGREGARLRRAVELAAQTRLSLALNVSEELALEALAYRLQALLTV